MKKITRKLNLFILISWTFLFAAEKLPDFVSAKIPLSFFDLERQGMKNITCGIIGINNKLFFYSFINHTQEHISLVYSVASKSLIGEYNLGKKVVFGPIFSRDGEKIAWVEKKDESTHVVKICDVKTGNNEYEYPCKTKFPPIPKFDLNTQCLSWTARNDQRDKLYCFMLKTGKFDIIDYTANLCNFFFSSNLRNILEVFHEPPSKNPCLIKVFDVCASNAQPNIFESSAKIIKCDSEIVYGINISLNGLYLTYSYPKKHESTNLTNLIYLTQNTILHTKENVIYSCFSPDSKYWAYLINLTSGKNQIFTLKILDLESNKETVIDEYVAQTAAAPIFSSDSSKLAHVIVQPKNSTAGNFTNTTIITVYDLISHETTTISNPSTNNLICLDFSYDCKEIIGLTASELVFFFIH